MAYWVLVVFTLSGPMVAMPFPNKEACEVVQGMIVASVKRTGTPVLGSSCVKRVKGDGV